MRMAVIDGAAVVNVIEFEKGSDFAPEGVTLVPTEEAGIGWTYAKGKFAPPVTSAPTVPASVTMRQARLALLGAGLLSQVQGAIDALPEPDRSTAQIEWEYATELKRDHPLITALGAGLGMSEDEVDALFVQAAGIA